jgi:hypothetical protein
MLKYYKIMSERHPSHQSIETLTLDEKIELFFAAVARHSLTAVDSHKLTRDDSIGLSIGPPNGDETIRVQASSMIADREFIEPIIRDGFNMREAVNNPLTAVMYPNLVYRAEWKAIRTLDPDGWLRGDYLQERAWRAARRKFMPTLDDIDQFENDVFNNFRIDIGVRNVGSNPAEREIPIHLLMRAFPELFPAGGSMLEVGTGPMHILKVLAAGMRIGEITVIKASSKGWEEIDVAATKAANLQLAQPVLIGPSTGIDLVDFNLDKMWRKWPEECTIRPADERAEPKEVALDANGQTAMFNPRQLYEYIDDLEIDNLEFMRIDLNDRGDAETLKAASQVRGINGYDILAYPTVLQQQSAAKRDVLMRDGRKQGKKDKHRHNLAWELVMDFCWPDPDDPKKLVFAKDIYEREGSYSLNVKDRNGEWQQMLIMQNDRCQRLKYGLGVLSVGRKSLSMADRLS